MSLLLVAASLSGCTGSAPAAVKVARKDLPFPVLSEIHGVTNASGNVSFTGAQGVAIAPDAKNSTVRFGLGPLVRTTGVLQACEAACEPHEAPEGFIIAEGSLIAFHNLSLNAMGPDRDSAVFFYEGGAQTGRFLRWNHSAAAFQLNGNVQVGGGVSAFAPAETLTPVAGPTAEQSVVLATVPLEGLEVAVFVRGSGQLDNGSAIIPLPPAFSVLVGDGGPITVQVTLTSKGPPLYVSEKAKDHIKVETTTGEASNATFDVFVQAPRAGAERFQSVRPG